MTRAARPRARRRRPRCPAWAAPAMPPAWLPSTASHPWHRCERLGPVTCTPRARGLRAEDAACGPCPGACAPADKALHLTCYNHPLILRAQPASAKRSSLVALQRMATRQHAVLPPGLFGCPAGVEGPRRPALGSLGALAVPWRMRRCAVPVLRALHDAPRWCTQQADACE